MRLGQVANQVSRHELTQGGVMVDDQKIKVILEWEKPKMTKGIMSFFRDPPPSPSLISTFISCV